MYNSGICSWRFDITFFHNYDKEYRISIDVIPNNELIALLLSFGSQLEVLEPQNVRDMMRDHVKTLNKFYK